MKVSGTLSFVGELHTNEHLLIRHAAIVVAGCISFLWRLPLVSTKTLCWYSITSCCLCNNNRRRLYCCNSLRLISLSLRTLSQRIQSDVEISSQSRERTQQPARSHSGSNLLPNNVGELICRIYSTNE